MNRAPPPPPKRKQKLGDGGGYNQYDDLDGGMPGGLTTSKSNPMLVSAAAIQS